MVRLGYASLLVPTLCCVVAATFNVASKNNVVVYYGQGPNQKPLSTYCADPSVDIIVLSFVHLFPQQANGYPGINFGNQCSGDRYPGPGYGGNRDASKDMLLKCPSLQKDLYTCRQTSTKKILLSLGGGTSTYQLSGATDGTSFATQLWGMFGPRTSSWTSAGLPRPFDYDDATSRTVVGFSVDGFDLDIEHPSTDGSAGYKALATKLRSLYASASGQYYLTASPQCVVPDANMGDMLKAAAFDMVFVQFYNTQQCSARRWADANPNYVPGGPSNAAGFTFDAWVSFLAGTQYSKSARVFIGLPGSSAAANAGFDLSSAQARSVAEAHYCKANFGGIAIWEATYAAANVEGGRNFFQNAKASLNAAASDKRLSCTASETLPQSTDARCGNGFGTTCGNTMCCSRWGWCGTTYDYCGTGCQAGFGKCS
ncbi:carbohydrate-binding module family 18 protein [Xylariaceae sp. FL1651]|nr:carbohydrate-binding module family 18 protein [Xylariaceae sp. FL1651]